MREKVGGWPKIVKIGYGKPKTVRHKYYSPTRGLLDEYVVSSMADLELALPHKHVIRINGRLGLRKREEIFLTARSWGLHVLNPVRVEEEAGVDETVEDLSLDRDLGMDLDLEDIEDVDVDDVEDVDDSADAATTDDKKED